MPWRRVGQRRDPEPDAVAHPDLAATGGADDLDVVGDRYLLVGVEEDLDRAQHVERLDAVDGEDEDSANRWHADDAAARRAGGQDRYPTNPASLAATRRRPCRSMRLIPQGGSLQSLGDLLERTTR
jgi:hypothetical protein